MVRSIHRTDVQELLERGAQLVDVLPLQAFRNIHLKGAISLPLKQLDRRSAEAHLDRSQPIIVYCGDYQ